MNTIDQLIKQHCPNGVPFYTLDELFETRNGYTPSKANKDFWENGTIPWFRMDDIRAHGGILEDSIEKVTKAAVKGNQLFPKDSILMSTSASVGFHALVTVPHLANQRFVSMHLKPEFHQRIDIKFAYYYAFVLDDLCLKNLTTSSFSSVSLKTLKKFKFPVPPLEVQQKIVEILNTFTKLEAELEAELEARQEQFLFYSEKLFELDTSYPVRSFGDLATIVRGSSPRPIRNYLVETGNPWIKIGDAPSSGRFIRSTAQFVSDAGAEKSRRVEPGDFLLSNSMSFGRPYISKISGYIHDGWLSVSGFEAHLDANYLYYFLRTQRVQKEFSQKAGSGTVKNLNAQIVKSLSVPVPPLNVQQRIATALANFDDLVSDLNNGLPAELTARRQQYEYYRDQLLTFKELEA